MTSDLDAFQQFPGRTDLAEHDREAAQAVASGLRDANAGTTRRVYASSWQQFLTWAQAGGHLALPATPQSVALYLGDLAAEGKTLATIEQARAAISHFHATPACRRATTPPATPWWPRA